MRNGSREQLFIYLTLFGIFISGFSLRVFYISPLKFPVNDGGLFYRMTLDLIDNLFRLPSFTTYNNIHIPYVYPPLGMYITGLIHLALKIDLSQVFIWLPFLLNLCAIPFVFLLASNLLSNRFATLYAVAFWTFASPSYEWLLMGGGITRSLAYTASFASLYLFSEYQKRKASNLLVISLILGGVTGLSHLEIFFVNTISVFCIWFFNHPNGEKRSIKTITIYLSGCILVMSPYLIAVIINHRLQPLVAGFLTGGFSFATTLFRLGIFNFAGEKYLAITSFLCVIGITYQIIAKKYFLVIWFLLILFLDGRSVHRSLIFPVALLAAITVNDIIALVLNKPFIRIKRIFLKSDPSMQEAGEKFTSIRGLVLVPLIFLHILFLSYLQLFESKSYIRTISDSELAAFRWVEQNTNTDAKFLILNPSQGWELDNVSEWFPALTRRESLTTVQGTEWLPDHYFEQANTRYDLVEQCMTRNNDCIDQVVENYSGTADYLLITLNECNNDTSRCGDDIYEEVERTSAYSKVYQNNDVVILVKN